jgi:hypothetical protein
VGWSRDVPYATKKKYRRPHDLDGPQNIVEHQKLSVCLLHKEDYVGVSNLAEYRYMIESPGVVEVGLVRVVPKRHAPLCSIQRAG